jgi:exopolysaccharide production protein ExoZ
MSKLIPIQLLRALAALAVAILHGQYETGLLADAVGRGFQPSRILPWEAGVDVFFVISGFVMVYASRRLFGRPEARRVFLSRRIARVVPLYWLTTTLYLALALMAPGSVKGMAEPGYVLASYAFVPVARADGAVEPLYSLGWTLNYEMAFYVLFALALGLSRRWAVGAVAAMLAGLVLLAAVLAAPLPFAFWGNSIVLEFGIGMAIGLLRVEGVVLGPAARLVLGAIGLALFALVAAQAPGLPRALLFGVPAGCLVAACGLGREHVLADETVAVRLGAVLGDASYALYLIHPFVIRGMRRTVEMAGLGPSLPPWLFLGVALLAAILASIAVFRLIERPLNAGARLLLERVGRVQPA